MGGWVSKPGEIRDISCCDPLLGLGCALLLKAVTLSWLQLRALVSGTRVPPLAYHARW